MDDNSSNAGLQVLFLSTRPMRPSYRFRVEQMLPYLAGAGHKCVIKFFPRNILSRLWQYGSVRLFDVVVIQKRLLSSTELALVRSLSKRLIFDFDDPLIFDRFGRPEHRRLRRFAAMAHSSDLMICGNEYLAEQASHMGGRTVVIPTAVDTDRFCLGLKPARSSTTVIGWTGSRGSIQSLNLVFPILAKLKGDIELKIIADSTEGLNFSALGRMPYRFVTWSADTEVAETAEFDIGLMPLPDNDVSRGKCGCKALQYMALGIPAICSPVGVNRDILRHGSDGFLPETPDSWQAVMQNLIDDVALRQRIGLAGRATVESRFALTVIARQLVQALEPAA